MIVFCLSKLKDNGFFYCYFMSLFKKLVMTAVNFMLIPFKIKIRRRKKIMLEDVINKGDFLRNLKNFAYITFRIQTRSVYVTKKSIGCLQKKIWLRSKLTRYSINCILDLLIYDQNFR